MKLFSFFFFEFFEFFLQKNFICFINKQHVKAKMSQTTKRKEETFLLQSYFVSKHFDV